MSQLQQSLHSLRHTSSSSGFSPAVIPLFSAPRETAVQALLVSQRCLLKAFHSTSSLFLSSFSPFFDVNAWCFFHFSNLNSLLLSSLSSQRKPRGACSYSLLLLCFIFFLMTQNYPPGVSSFQPGSGRERMVNPILFCLFKGSPKSSSAHSG